MKYFYKYSKNTRVKVETIVINMYITYISLIKTIFFKDLIVVNKLHLVKLIPRLWKKIKKTRIN